MTSLLPPLPSVSIFEASTAKLGMKGRTPLSLRARSNFSIWAAASSTYCGKIWRENGDGKCEWEHCMYWSWKWRDDVTCCCCDIWNSLELELNLKLKWEMWRMVINILKRYWNTKMICVPIWNSPQVYEETSTNEVRETYTQKNIQENQITSTSRI